MTDFLIAAAQRSIRLHQLCQQLVDCKGDVYSVVNKALIPNNHNPFLRHCRLGTPALDRADIPYLGNNLQFSITQWLLTTSQRQTVGMGHCTFNCLNEVRRDRENIQMISLVSSLSFSAQLFVLSLAGLQ
jgi:hypothetical protein